MIYGFIAIGVLMIISLLILCMMLDYQYQCTRLMSEIKYLKHQSIGINTNSHGQLHLN
jgi:hypothetical protein